MTAPRDFSCAEVLGGIEPTELSVRLPGARGEVWSRPYRGALVGGDVHYLASCGVSQLSKVVVADVSGHGGVVADAARIIHAALVENVNEHDNGRLLSSINRAFLSRDDDVFHFTTMVATIYDSQDRSLVYAYAGHPPLLIGRRSSGRFEPLDYDHGVPIGIVDDVLYEQQRLLLAKGDVLVYYTDALVEVRGPDGKPLGENGLRAILEDVGSFLPADLKDAVLDRVGSQLDDDATLIILETV
jgi:sigma-B regulation protein RsbU (phosphoserine phosphatase)